MVNRIPSYATVCPHCTREIDTIEQIRARERERKQRLWDSMELSNVKLDSMQPWKNADRHRIYKMARGGEARAPDRKIRGLCGTRLSRSTYWGDFLPGARHLALATQFASWAQMFDYRKCDALIKKRLLTLIGKGSCPSQSYTAPSATGDISCSASRGRYKIAIGV
jgi:hypothetical protein